MKDKITQGFIDFFRSIGVDPYLVFFLVLCLITGLKIKGYIDEKEKDKWDYLYDAVFFVVSFGLMIFFILYLFGALD